jgi:2-hydroxy-3-oxopropionate reductase
VTLGFVGLGAMGGPMARRLLTAGHDVAVYDANPATIESFPSRCASARAAADAAETVLVSLPTPEIVRAVATELADGDAIRVYVDLSTTGVAVAEEVARLLEGRGVRCVDAPVSGGVPGAEAGTLTVMVAASEDALATVRPVLDMIGKNVFVVGSRPGQGQLAKVINNLLSATAILVSGEAVALGVKGGLDPRVLVEAIGVSSGANTAVADKFPKHVLTRQFATGFRLELMAKDVRLCLAEAQRLGVPMRAGAAIGELWDLAEDRLPADADCTEMVKLVEDWAGVTIAG